MIDAEKALLQSLQTLVKEELQKELSFSELAFALDIPVAVALQKLGMAKMKKLFIVIKY